MVGNFAVVLAGRAASSLLAATGVVLSGTAMLSALMALPDPATLAPIGVDDFALRRSHRGGSSYSLARPVNATVAGVRCG